MKKFIILFACVSALASCDLFSRDVSAPSTSTGGSHKNVETPVTPEVVTPSKDASDSKDLVATPEVIQQPAKNSEGGAGSAITIVDYPSDLANSAAAKFCTQKGGEIIVENQNQTNVLYCQINNKKLDAWQFFGDNQ